MSGVPKGDFSFLDDERRIVYEDAWKSANIPSTLQTFHSRYCVTEKSKYKEFLNGLNLSIHNKETLWDLFIMILDIIRNPDGWKDFVSKETIL